MRNILSRVIFKQFTEEQLSGFGFSIRTGDSSHSQQLLSPLLLIFSIYLYFLFSTVKKITGELPYFFKFISIYILILIILILVTKIKIINRNIELMESLLVPFACGGLSLIFCNSISLFAFQKIYTYELVGLEKVVIGFSDVYIWINLPLIPLMIMGYIYHFYIIKKGKVHKVKNEGIENLKMQAIIQKFVPVAVGLSLLARFITGSMEGVIAVLLVFCGYILAFFMVSFYMPFYLKVRFPDIYRVNRNNSVWK